jgi:hypothetical protein
MGKSTYSFGVESPVKFTISDRMARYYNEAAEEWFRAQTRFNQKFGRKWDPRTEPILINWTKKQKKAWNQFAKVYKDTLTREGPFHVNDIMDDYLVKNSRTQALNRASSGTGPILAGIVSVSLTMSARYISTAVTLAVLRELLRGL